jgi:hypothetical protein
MGTVTVRHSTARLFGWEEPLSELGTVTTCGYLRERGQAPAIAGSDAVTVPGLLNDCAGGLVLQDLPLDPLEGVVDRFRVAAELRGHLFVGRALEVEAKRVGFE